MCGFGRVAGVRRGGYWPTTPSRLTPPRKRSRCCEARCSAPKAFRAAAKKIQPSLVTIEGFGGLAAGSGQTKGIHAPGEGPTTGLIISSDGYIVTSTFNFIRKPPIIAVRLPSGERTKSPGCWAGMRLAAFVCSKWTA